MGLRGLIGNIVDYAGRLVNTEDTWEEVKERRRQAEKLKKRELEEEEKFAKERIERESEIMNLPELLSQLRAHIINPIKSKDGMQINFDRVYDELGHSRPAIMDKFKNRKYCLELICSKSFWKAIDYIPEHIDYTPNIRYAVARWALISNGKSKRTD